MRCSFRCFLFWGFTGCLTVLLKVNKTLALQSSISQKQICPVFPYSLEFYWYRWKIWGFFPPIRRYDFVDVQPEKTWLTVHWKHVRVKLSISVTRGQGNTVGVWVSFSCFVIVFL